MATQTIDLHIRVVVTVSDATAAMDDYNARGVRVPTLAALVRDEIVSNLESLPWTVSLDVVEKGGAL